ncbi:MAG TPA: Holliday junction resolvase RuvX [Candidatus Paceibacterota bacterium]|jgi:putative Holliday junction resolvase|nr:Holliday junction resolvase RuvX [Candidatus Paceibacterota bacterium]HRS48074.1 Holliday junction resolvase RuvX [Candidatus Paceibacterota bacterium]
MDLRKILAIDWGEKNIGLAISDSALRLAFPYKNLRIDNDDELLKNLKEICKQEKIKTIVFGLPLNFQFEETTESEKIRIVANRVENELKIKVAFMNEILTSQLANDLKKNKYKDDSISASIILSDYLKKIKEFGNG